MAITYTNDDIEYAKEQPNKSLLYPNSYWDNKQNQVSVEKPNLQYFTGIVNNFNNIDTTEITPNGATLSISPEAVDLAKNEHDGIIVLPSTDFNELCEFEVDNNKNYATSVYVDVNDISPDQVSTNPAVVNLTDEMVNIAKNTANTDGIITFGDGGEFDQLGDFTKVNDNYNYMTTLDINVRNLTTEVPSLNANIPPIMSNGVYEIADVDQNPDDLEIEPVNTHNTNINNNKKELTLKKVNEKEMRDRAPINIGTFTVNVPSDVNNVEDVLIEGTGRYYIDTYNYENNTEYSGFGSVNVKLNIAEPEPQEMTTSSENDYKQSTNITKCIVDKSVEVPAGFEAQGDVTVSTKLLKDYTINNNGEYDILNKRGQLDSDVIGFKKVTVNVPNETVDRTITENGRYMISEYNSENNTNYVGFRNVIVEVPEQSNIRVEESKQFHTSVNGVFDIIPSENYDAIETVYCDVSVPTKIVSGKVVYRKTALSNPIETKFSLDSCNASFKGTETNPNSSMIMIIVGLQLNSNGNLIQLKKYVVQKSSYVVVPQNFIKIAKYTEDETSYNASSYTGSISVYLYDDKYQTIKTAIFSDKTNTIESYDVGNKGEYYYLTNRPTPVSPEKINANIAIGYDNTLLISKFYIFYPNKNGAEISYEIKSTLESGLNQPLRGDETLCVLYYEPDVNMITCKAYQYDSSHTSVSLDGDRYKIISYQTINHATSLVGAVFNVIMFDKYGKIIQSSYFQPGQSLRWLEESTGSSEYTIKINPNIIN